MRSFTLMIVLLMMYVWLRVLLAEDKAFLGLHKGLRAGARHLGRDTQGQGAGGVVIESP